MKVLVTGAAGFVGSRLCMTLADQGLDVVATSRLGGFQDASITTSQRVALTSGSIMHVPVGNIADHDWARTLHGVDVVIHLAGRAHTSSAGDDAAFRAYRNDNVIATKIIAEACAEAGVSRLVFVSSVKVLGERSLKAPFSETDVPRPGDVYGITKLEAEQALMRVASESSLEAVIVRPPLVYGPGVRANFLRLMKLVYRGLPLPLKNAHNLRSLIFLDNLVSSLIACATDRRASGVYLVCDKELLSVRALLEELARALNKKLRLFHLPKPVLELAAKSMGREAELRRLLSPLVISSEKIAREIDWAPPFTACEGISATTKAFMHSRGGRGTAW